MPHHTPCRVCYNISWILQSILQYYQQITSYFLIITLCSALNIPLSFHFLLIDSWISYRVFYLDLFQAIELIIAWTLFLSCQGRLARYSCLPGFFSTGAVIDVYPRYNVTLAGLVCGNICLFVIWDNKADAGVFGSTA